MAGLNNEKCEACRRDSPSVTSEEIAQLKPQVPNWELIHENGIPKLDRVFTFDNFQSAINFTLRLGELAEDQGHHPRLIVVEFNGKILVPEYWAQQKINDGDTLEIVTIVGGGS